MSEHRTRKWLIDDTEAFYASDPGRRAVVDDDRCMYRAEDGRKCAPGRWIMDDAYSPEFENYSASGLEDVLPDGLDSILMPEVRGHPMRFWDAIQHLHDYHSYWYGTEESTVRRKEYVRRLHADFDEPEEEAMAVWP